MRYLRKKWKNPDKGGECGADIPSCLAGPWTQLGSKDAFLLLKKNQLFFFFFKYQPSQVLAGLEVKPSLQVLTFCTQRLALPHALAMCHARATLLTSRRVSGARELPAALHCLDRAACTTQCTLRCGQCCPCRQRTLITTLGLPNTVRAFISPRHGKGIESPVHTSDENFIKTCKTFCFLCAPPKGIP